MTPLSGGCADPAIRSAFVFRALLEAMARPGLVAQVSGASPPAPLSPAAGAVLLALADGSTPLHLAGEADRPAVREWLAFHTGAPLAGAEEALFALGSWEALQPVARFCVGDPAYPDRSATLIVELPRLEAEGPLLRGPGIKDSARLSLPETAAFVANRALYPLGFDAVLTCGDRLAALPRSTIVEDR